MMRTRKGFALVTVLAIVILIGLGTAALLQMIQSRSAIMATTNNDVKAQYIAEAGMQHALWKCRTAACVDESLTIEGYPVAIDVTDDATYGKKIDITVTYQEA